MIICQPKRSALFSLGLFAVLCYGGLFFLLLDAAYRIAQPSYFYPAVIALLGLALLLTLRLAFGYKTIVAENGKIAVRQKFLLRHRRFDLKQLIDWDEQTIKTFNGEYCQLNLRFSNGHICISKHEYSNYERLKSYVRQKIASKKR